MEDSNNNNDTYLETNNLTSSTETILLNYGGTGFYNTNTEGFYYNNTSLNENVEDDEDSNEYNENSTDDNQNDETDSDDELYHEDSLNISCPICKENYSKSRIIHVAFPCGHSFCQNCIDKINICAICRSPIKEHVVNWTVQSKLDGETDDNEIDIIDPFYQVFIKYKQKIEKLYLVPSSRDYLNTEQKKLISEILLGLKNSELTQEALDKLLIPKWLKDAIEDKIEIINNYQDTMSSDLIDLLPFCP